MQEHWSRYCTLLWTTGWTNQNAETEGAIQLSSCGTQVCHISFYVLQLVFTDFNQVLRSVNHLISSESVA